MHNEEIVFASAPEINPHETQPTYEQLQHGRRDRRAVTGKGAVEAQDRTARPGCTHARIVVIAESPVRSWQWQSRRAFPVDAKLPARAKSQESVLPR